MAVYQPEAVVLQCGPDSLSRELCCEFNLSVKGHADCLRFIRSFNVPLMVLGGEGRSVTNVARCRCYETAVAVGKRLNNNLPPNEYMAYFKNEYKLHIQPNKMKNDNTIGDIEKLRIRLLTQLSLVIHAPSVQFQDIPSISQAIEAGEVDMEKRQNPRILSGSAS